MTDTPPNPTPMPPPLKATRPAAPPTFDAPSDAPDSARAAGRLDRWSAVLFSFVFHGLALLALALISEQLASRGDGLMLDSGLDTPEQLSLSQAAVAKVEPGGDQAPETLTEQPVELAHVAPPDLARDLTGSTGNVGPALANSLHGLLPAGRFVSGGGMDGRTGPLRQTAGDRGATEDSESAVARGLRWLAAHQHRDGRWNFDLAKGPCRGMCRNSGSESSTTAATAMALLAFLGAGHTHRADGPYQEVVQRGLYYLSVRAVVSPHGVDLREGEGSMYAQGLATMALCEAYGMTRDPALKDLAQRSVNFVLYAQDQKGGGWRYTPGEPGDTSVTGWQFMAMKSAHMAGLEISSPSVALASHFLDTVETEDGAQYGYMTPAPHTHATTAVGLLCRMYTGWQHNRPALVRGVAYLDAWGPTPDEIYYNFYSTQVLCHYGGPSWEKWNLRLRDHLIATQADSGHEAGSWFFTNDAGTIRGGRIYSTAMAIMTLEVYYRYMPLYASPTIERGF